MSAWGSWCTQAARPPSRRRTGSVRRSMTRVSKTAVISGDGSVPERGDGFDLVVSVGGDGTFLRGAHAASDLGCPVLGVMVGRLGFLTEVEPGEAVALIRTVLAGTAADRGAAWPLTVEPIEGATFAPQWGLNEVMVEKRARHRLVRLGGRGRWRRT